MVGDVPLLQATGVAKSYHGVIALDGIDFELMRGEVHALLGQNGAGKSTLVRVLTGAEHPDAGEIRIEGDIVDVSTPRKAQENGIAAIYQDVTLELVPQLSVAENVYLGREQRRRPARIDWPELLQGAEDVLRRLDFDPRLVTEPVGRLTRGEQQTVALAKALSMNIRVLIMDEPTASLNTHETGTLFNTVRALSEAGVGIIYISHRLEELLACAERVTVLRDGRVVGTIPVATESLPDPVAATSSQQSNLVRMMVGHDVSEQYPRVDSKPGNSSLILDGLSDADGTFSDVNLTVHAGETVGIYGITGCGGRELIRSIFGLEPVQSGKIIVDGRALTLRSPRDAIASGIAFIPDDRTSEGLLAERSMRGKCHRTDTATPFVAWRHQHAARSRPDPNECQRTPDQNPDHRAVGEKPERRQPTEGCLRQMAVESGPHLSFQ